MAFNLVAKSKYKLKNTMFDAQIIFPNRFNICLGNMSLSMAGSMKNVECKIERIFLL